MPNYKPWPLSHYRWSDTRVVREQGPSTRIFKVTPDLTARQHC